MKKNKKTLRQQMRAHRATLTPSMQQESSRRVCESLSTHSTFLKARVIASYMAHDGEIDPANLVTLFPEKTWAFPCINEEKGDLHFSEFTKNNTGTTNRYGILEPNTKEICSLSQIDLMLIPLVAFDERAYRLGHGSGYYDRSLAQDTRPVLFGLAYDWQRVEHIPNDPWDIPLDNIITSA